MSSGKYARTSLSALFISLAFPSKKRPHPRKTTCFRKDWSRPLSIWFLSHFAFLTSDKKSITGEYRALVSIFHVIANTVLCVARCMQRLHGDAVPDLERFVMAGYFGNTIAISSSNDWTFTEFLKLKIKQPLQQALAHSCNNSGGFIGLYQLTISTGMIPMTSISTSVKIIQSAFITIVLWARRLGKNSLLMGVDNGSKIDLPRLDLSFHLWRNPKHGQAEIVSNHVHFEKAQRIAYNKNNAWVLYYLLRRISWINNNRFLRRFISY